MTLLRSAGASGRVCALLLLYREAPGQPVTGERVLIVRARATDRAGHARVRGCSCPAGRAGTSRARVLGHPVTATGVSASMGAVVAPTTPATTPYTTASPLHAPPALTPLSTY